MFSIGLLSAGFGKSLAMLGTVSRPHSARVDNSVVCGSGSRPSSPMPGAPHSAPSFNVRRMRVSHDEAWNRFDSMHPEEWVNRARPARPPPPVDVGKSPPGLKELVGAQPHRILQTWSCAQASHFTPPASFSQSHCPQKYRRPPSYSFDLLKAFFHTLILF
jgi:hypothetical protein